MKKQKFAGPIFVVGMPRSGTKLLRDLLNNNALISIPEAESHFIPFLINQFGNDMDFADEQKRYLLFQELLNTSFYHYMKSDGRELTWEHISSQNIKNWQDFIEFVLRFFAPKSSDEFQIWGDKTPGYITYMAHLKKIFVDAKFVHIIRDPRDYCLSVRSVWGKNLFRAADRWRSSIISARNESKRFSQDYYEIKYEALVTDPSEELRKLCDFLSVPYSQDMIKMEKPSENLGDTRGIAKIVGSNLKKYQTQLSNSEIKRIEELVTPVAHQLGYEYEADQIKFKPLKAFEQHLYKLLDGVALFRFYSKEYGLAGAAKFVLNNYSKSSWRKYDLP